MAEKYYYNGLNKELRRVYHEIYTGLCSLAPSFAVTRLPIEKLSELLTLVRLDNPEIFYVSGFSYRAFPEAENVEFIPDYIFPKKQIQEHQKAIAARVRKLTLPALQLDEAGRELFVHDFICTSVRYDKLKKPYSHEVIGPLTQGVGVCEGIAKTVKLLCDTLSIPCIVALSENNLEKGIKYRHAWNVVKIGGKHYQLDATFDNSLGSPGQIRYDYFNIGDTFLFRDHEPVIWQVPECADNSRGYYCVKKLGFTKTEELRKRAAQHAKKRKPLVFQWRGGFLTREQLIELCAIISEEAERQGKTAAISLNWPQAVISVRFPEETEAAEITIETSNEGELL